ncbi:hypothetical protein HK105_201644 [Polyrhizophydium stewartii]|uniref:ubiquitinyl hydrolase 1 n=1 Tax=Polyrhizophydium stewartii TaxID=2732419 RepID=A0ABR4NH75_9FUNG|nr:hypothetical protein HK105_005569 [Polyrhizophydium stewartii]
MSDTQATTNAADPAGGAAAADARPSDEEILRYERQIKAGEMEMPLVGDMVGFQRLHEASAQPEAADQGLAGVAPAQPKLTGEYENGLPVYMDKIDHLKKTCLGMRSVRKDGNCFYRAFGFRLAELVWENRGLPWHRAVLERATATKALMTTMGYDMSILEDFWEKFEEVLKFDKEDRSELATSFRTEYISDTVVCYLRLITAALLKRDRDLYEAFVLDSYPTLESFIGECVEPMNVESDQIHIVAMSNIFGIDIRIANLDSTRAEKGINFHEISPMEPMQVDQSPIITLLYRPGHYDVLYPRPIV